MNKYANLSGNSDIESYEACENWINIKYTDGTLLKYSSEFAGQITVDKMIVFAREGVGLSRFIAKYAKFLYDH